MSDLTEKKNSSAGKAGIFIYKSKLEPEQENGRPTNEGHTS